jgi:hypothetical protein
MTSENRRDMEKVVIEKPVTPLARPGTEQPAGLSMKLTTGAPLAAREIGPTVGGPGARFVGKPGTMPTPGAFPISPNVRAEFGKLNPELARGIRNGVAKK